MPASGADGERGAQGRGRWQVSIDDIDEEAG